MQEFTGLEYLKMDIASNFGLDKEDWDVRLDWFHKHEPELEDLVRLADEPAMYFAGVQAYRRAEQGLPSGYPVSFDATASGLQLLAVLVGCEKSARLCNVVSTGHREDAYTNLYQFMLKELGTGSKIQRKDTKQAIMTSLYASTAIPKKVFGEGEQLKVFYRTMEERAPGAWQLNQALQALWQPYADAHSWTMPDNFHVHIPVEEVTTKFVQVLNRPTPVEIRINCGTKEGRSISPNIVHSIDGMIVREIHRRCSYDVSKIQELLRLLKIPVFGTPRQMDADDEMVDTLWFNYKQTGFLSARILDYLNAGNLGLVDVQKIQDLILSLPELPFDVISVHDCFRCLPNYGNDLRRQYNEILAELAGSDILAWIATQITGHQASVTKMGLNPDDIREADYPIC